MCLFIHTLCVTVLHYSGRVKQVQPKLYGLQSLKYFLSEGLHKKLPTLNALDHSDHLIVPLRSI